MLTFTILDDGRVLVTKHDSVVGLIESQSEGDKIYNCHAEINYSISDVEEILSKMKGN